MGHDFNLCIEEDRIKKELICSICTDIYDNASIIAQGQCLHTFCDKCIRDSLRHDSSQVVNNVDSSKHKFLSFLIKKCSENYSI